MSYVQIVVGLIKLATSLATWFEQRGYLKQGEANAIADAFKKEAANVDIALRVRREARRYNELNPDRVRDDDGFRRLD